MKRTEFNIEISAENVLESLGVTRQSELYEEMQEELSELLPGAYEKIKPVALLEFGNLKEHSVMRNGRRKRRRSAPFIGRRCERSLISIAVGAGT